MNQQPDKVIDCMDRYLVHMDNIRELRDRYVNIDKHFSSWSGPTREAIQQNVKDSEPAFDNMIETVDSFRTAARGSAVRLEDLERDLTNKLAA